jgi:hypothetical protein
MVPSGGSATFEVRLSVNAIPRRFIVTIRPAGRPNEVLAQATREITDKDLQQFASLVAQQLRVTVQSTAATANPRSFIVIVTNGSSLPVAAVPVDVEISATCRAPGSHPPAGPAWVFAAVLLAVPTQTPPPQTPLPKPTPIPTRTLMPTLAPLPTFTVMPTPVPIPSQPPTPAPTQGTIQETWRGSATVQQVRPGGTGRSPVQLSGGVCLEFTSWTATSRIGEVKLGE